MGSESIDFALILFMGFLAFNRFMNEQYGFAAMFCYFMRSKYRDGCYQKRMQKRISNFKKILA